MKKNKNIIRVGMLVFTLALVVMPVLSYAVGPADGGEGTGSGSGTTTVTTVSCTTAYSTSKGIEGIINYFTCVLGRSVVPLLFAFAFVVFLWGVAQFMTNSADETKRTQGKQFMIWGIVGLFVMFSVWGLVLVLRKSIDPTAKDTLFIPALPKQE